MNKTNPPYLFLKFLRWFCHPDLLLPIEGDLVELFDEQVKEKGIKQAKLMFAKDVLLLFRPSIIKPTEGTLKVNNYGMFKNYLKVAYRNLSKRKSYTIINSLGLTIAIASCLILGLYVQNEFSYDQFFQNSDRIYKLVEEKKSAEEIKLNSRVPYSFVGNALTDYPEIESATAFSGPYNDQRVGIKSANGGETRYLENNVFLADSNFFSVFSVKLLNGNRKTALKSPNSVVLSAKTARRYFGDKDPMGEFISAAGKNSIVTGIFEDLPSNSHLNISYLVSSTSVAWFSQDHFNLRKAHCYFKLRQDADVTLLENKFPEMVDTYVGKEIERIHQMSWEDYQKAGNSLTYYLKPLTSIHLDPEISVGGSAGGNITTLNILIAVAILIFLIACINFMNLSTALSTERAKEVGIRKVMGSAKSQLVFQFLTESFIISFISLLLAVGIVSLLLPYFNQVSGKSLVLSYNLHLGLLLFGTSLFISLLAGMYPAFIVSSLKPIASLRGKSTIGNQGKWLKNGLVVFQFWISIILISTTVIFQKQIDFLADKDLGFDSESLIIIEGVFNKNAEIAKPFLTAIRNFPEVKSAAGTLWTPAAQGSWSGDYKPQGSSSVFTTSRGAVGDQLSEVMGLELISGSFFSKNTNDSLAVVLNETAINTMGIQDPIGKKIALITNDEGNAKEKDYTILGVVKDFNYYSLHSEIGPLVMESNEKFYGRMGNIVVKLNGENSKSIISKIENKWNEIIPGRPFQFRFMDDVLASKYESEKKLSTVFTLFSSLSTFIAIIGLLALSAFTISLRSKEIGIRKVVGASIKNIIIMLSADYTWLISISIILAIPFAWYSMNEWLTGFAYRINLTLDTFLFSGMFALAITWLVIGILSFKAASANPVNSLKNE